LPEWTYFYCLHSDLMGSFDLHVWDGSVQNLTLEQLRATAEAGGIASVTLRAEGGSFLVSVATRSGGAGLLITTRAKEPRRFADPRNAMLLLREMGIATAQLDTSNWNPAEGTTGTPRPDRAAAMKRAHEAAAHDRWFRTQVEAGLREASDPAATMLPHEQVMTEMKAVIDRVTAEKPRVGKKNSRRAR
jgi:hypothetical protein